MEPYRSTQQQFIEQIKQKRESKIPLVNDIADKLNISNDSAYRRIRCDKEFTFQEMAILSRTYNISLDTLISNKPDDITFNYRSFSHEGFTLKKYLESIEGNLKLINAFPGEKRLFYLSKDFPIFHYFDFPTIAAFKMFFWQRFILGNTQFQNRDFSVDTIPDEIIHTGKKILYQYNKVPSLEIWNNETINGTLNQIEYFYESGLFSKSEDVLLVLNDLTNMVEHMRSMAENGIKYHFKGKQLDVEPNFRLFFNEVTLGDNSIFFKLGDQRISFIVANILNILTSQNEQFCDDIENMISNIMKQSIEISNSSQKVRAKFFKTQLDKIEKTKKLLRV